MDNLLSVDEVADIHGVDENLILRFMIDNPVGDAVKLDGEYFMPYESAQALSVEEDNGMIIIAYEGYMVYEEAVS